MRENLSRMRAMKFDRRSWLSKPSICGLLALCLARPVSGADATSGPTTKASAPAMDGAPSAPLPAGVRRIFNGNTLDGWIQIPENSWTAKNGVVASNGVGRGVMYTAEQYGSYRIVFDVRHVMGNKDHKPCVLFFCSNPTAGEKPLDALGGIQFQVPTGGHFDYRKGHNNGGDTLFTPVPHPKVDLHQWSRIEILVDASTGTARMAVAQPPGGNAVEVVTFKDPTAARPGPFALQMHNKGLFDDYANIAVEVNPVNHDLITVK